MTETEIPRPEYPRPQFVRDRWINLNGEWSYALDPGKSGMQRGLPQSTGLPGRIRVPFCPESRLSGVGHTDFIEMMWYQRPLVIPADWAGQQVILHFGAVDWESELFIDGQPVGRHWGGTSSFSYDITPYVTPGGQHSLVLYVRDDTRSGVQPGGKQCPDYASRGCHYTRVTGIWQTVWLEAVSPFGLEGCQIVPDLDQSRFVLTPRFHKVRRGHRFRATLLDGETVLSQVEMPATDGLACVLSVPQPARPWSPADPFLYDLRLQVLDGAGQVLDRVDSYAGLRKVHIEGNRIYLNNEPIYLRLVLDQGFYPDGIWTAPSDAALRQDIELSMKAGFNGARLHQKVFEERFHYWADRLGYLTWGESSSWGIDCKDPLGARNFLSEWREIVVRDRNHPSIVAWTPFNETHDVGDKRQHYRLHIDAYDLTHDLDPTRPVNDASGYVHVKTDLWTVHTYQQNPALLREQLAMREGQVMRCFPEREVAYAGQPYLVDEFGGIKWIPNAAQQYAANSWGYGDAPQTLDAFFERLDGQIEAILSFDHICGYCYTQLTDVEQEQNGIYNYDRTAKFDMEQIRAMFARQPAWCPGGEHL